MCLHLTPTLLIVLRFSPVGSLLEWLSILLLLRLHLVDVAHVLSRMFFRESAVILLRV
jgi:hypothetical protein